MFNLKDFKAGVAAIDRDGNKYWYVGINPKYKRLASELVFCDKSGRLSDSYLSGSQFNYAESCYDLVNMDSEPK
jgi:hypothetical protein